MKKFDLYVGCNVDGKPEYGPDDVRFVCVKALKVSGFDGATFTDSIGLWQGVKERTVICTICTDRKRDDVLEVTRMIRDDLQQNCVMVVETEPAIDFI